MGQNLTLECLSVRCAWVPMAISYHVRPLGGASCQGPSLGHLSSTRHLLGLTTEEGRSMPSHGEVPQ
jgi:hypothetical protein